MARKKRPSPDFEGLPPNEGAKAFLRYLYEVHEEQEERIDRLVEQLNKMYGYFDPMYQMIYQIHQGAARTTPSVPDVGLVARTIISKTKSLAREKLEQWFKVGKEKGWI